MKRGFASLVVSAALTLASLAHAQPRDPAAARELAKQAYELKQNKSWEAARQKFEESLRLDPQPKHLINLADCEAELGRLVDAQRHLVEARDTTKDDAELNGIALGRLAVVEQKMPRLTVHLVADAPKNTTVLRDGVILQGPSLDVALPTDPGRHVVVVRAPGRADQSAEILLAESESKRMDVGPGAPLPAVAASPNVVPPEKPSERTSLRTMGVVASGIGVIGLGIATVFALTAHEKRDATTCDKNICPNEEEAEKLRAAKTNADLATVFFIAGGVVAAGGGVMFLLAPSSSTKVSIALDRVVLTRHF